MVKNVLVNVPYAKEVIMGAEIAKLAFDFLVENTPALMKRRIRGAWNTSIMGRFKAFKLWAKKLWTGNSAFHDVLGDYQDFLSIYDAD